MSVYGKMSVSGRPRGGALPEYQGGGVYTPGADMNVRLSDAAGVAAGQAAEETARALAGLGRAVDRAVQTGVNAYADYAGAKSAQLMTAYQARVREAMYGEGGILTRKGEAAFDADAALKTRMEEIRRETLGEYGEGDSLVGRFFALRSREFDAANALAAQRHKSEEYERWWEGEHAALADALAGQAADAWAEPEMFGVYLAQTEQAARELLLRKGYGEEAVKNGLRETRSTVFRKAVAQALDREDITGAERLLAFGRVPSAGGAEAGTVRVREEAQERPEGAEAGKEAAPVRDGAADGRKGRPPFMELRQEDAAWARGKIDAARRARESRALTEAKRQQEAAGPALAQDIATRLRALPEEEREAETYRMLDEIPDREVRQKAASLVERELAFQARRQQATDADAARRLAAGTLNMTPVERAQAFAQSGASQSVRNMATELLNNGARTDAVALSRAREDISNGMSMEEVSGKYGTLINERDMEGLRALSVDEAKKLANRRQNVVFNQYLATSGLDKKDEDDLAYINDVKAEWEEKMANGEFKSPLEQKNWLYEQLARRINVNDWWWNGTYTPREALGADDAVLPVPEWEKETIRRQLVREWGMTAPTEEQIQAIYNGRDAR